MPDTWVILPDGGRYMVHEYKPPLKHVVRVKKAIKRSYVEFVIRATTVEEINSFIRQHWEIDGGLQVLMGSIHRITSERWSDLAQQFLARYGKPASDSSTLVIEYNVPKTRRGSEKSNVPTQPTDRQVAEQVVRTPDTNDTSTSVCHDDAPAISDAVTSIEDNTCRWERRLSVLDIPDVHVASDQLIPEIISCVEAWDDYHRPNSRLFVYRGRGSNKIDYLKGQSDLVFFGIGDRFGGGVRVCFVELKSGNGLENDQKAWKDRIQGIFSSVSYKVFRLNELVPSGIRPIIEWMSAGQERLGLNDKIAATHITVDTSHHNIPPERIELFAIAAAFEGADAYSRGQILASYLSARSSERGKVDSA